ncbi:hypothetical protein K474DRAFT_1712689 [Panus rudis PR-1116 ss-1]|nr:hypothetical protein K474DRAFT_1712689 [Panus rudis PR-1116 ss-1]
MILPDDTPASPSKTTRHLPAVPIEHPPPPAYPGNSSHQAAQPVYGGTTPLISATPVPHSDYVRRTRRRFLKSLAIALLIYLLTITFFSSLIDSSGHSRRRHHWNEADLDDEDARVPSDPTKGDGVEQHCVYSPSDWERSGDGQYATSFDLPLSSKVLYLFTSGAWSNGDVEVVQDPTLNEGDKVRMDILLATSRSWAEDELKVCSLQRRPGENGVGIFTPLRRGIDYSFRFSIAVRIPAQRHSMNISAFEAKTPKFSYVFNNVLPGLVFNSLTIETTNGEISTPDLVVGSARLQTTNRRILGSITASSSLQLDTTNSPLEGFVTLLSDNGDTYTKLQMKTTNGHIMSFVSLNSTSSSGKGGRFSVSAKSTNDPLQVNIHSAPLESHIDFNGESTNAPTTVTLPRTFEGSLNVRSTNAHNYLYQDENAEDPAGKGRTRTVTLRGLKQILQGYVYWEKGGEKRGSVTVQTTNSPALIKLS